MIHKSNLGRFGTNLPCDRNGFVPEQGDALESFDFGGDIDDDEWDDFVEVAVNATEVAVKEVADWRAS